MPVPKGPAKNRAQVSMGEPLGARRDVLCRWALGSAQAFQLRFFFSVWNTVTSLYEANTFIEVDCETGSSQIAYF